MKRENADTGRWLCGMALLVAGLALAVISIRWAMLDIEYVRKQVAFESLPREVDHTAPPASPNQLSIRDFRPFTGMRTEQEAALRAAQPDEPGLFESFGAAGAASGLTGWVIHGIGRLSEEGEAGFLLTEELLKEYTDDLPAEWIDEFEGAVSISDMNRIRSRLLTRKSNLAQLATTGDSAHFFVAFAALADPIVLVLLIPGAVLICRTSQAKAAPGWIRESAILIGIGAKRLPRRCTVAAVRWWQGVKDEARR